MRGQGWADQYEETATRLYAAGDFQAADDIRTLVDGLLQYEREHANGVWLSRDETAQLFTYLKIDLPRSIGWLALLDERMKP